MGWNGGGFGILAGWWDDDWGKESEEYKYVPSSPAREGCLKCDNYSHRTMLICIFMFSATSWRRCEMLPRWFLADRGGGAAGL